MNFDHFPKGCGILEVTHTPTGNFFYAVADSLQYTARHTYNVLQIGSHHNPSLQELVSKTGIDAVEFDFIKCEDRQEARAKRHELLIEHYTNPKLLNGSDFPKVPGAYRIIHRPSGKFFVGHSVDVVKLHKHNMIMLRAGNHRNEAFQQVFNESNGSDDFTFEFIRTQDGKEAREYAQKWFDEYWDTGLILNNMKVNRVKREIPGAYKLIHKPTGRFYVGSTKDIPWRITSHFNQMETGKHQNRFLQEVWNGDRDEFVVEEFPTRDREEAFLLEQKMIDEMGGDENCVNIAKNAKSPISSILLSEEVIAKRKASLKKRQESPEYRKQMGERMREMWSDPERRANRRGAGNPFAKQICIGPRYFGSVKDASRTLGVSELLLRNRANDQNSPGVFFPENPLPLDVLKANNREVENKPKLYHLYCHFLKEYYGIEPEGNVHHGAGDYRSGEGVS